MINSLSGPKSANLIGTIGSDKLTNLAMISSVFHLGASPALMGFISRPHSAQSPRHTLMNILETKQFTINHIDRSFFEKAHQTSARYAKEESEFTTCGLEEEFIDDFQAPFVRASQLKIGLKLVEHLDIKHNNTSLIIGEIKCFTVDKKHIDPDGSIDIEALGSLAVTGLDSYHELKKIGRLSYAKPDHPPVRID